MLVGFAFASPTTPEKALNLKRLALMKKQALVQLKKSGASACLSPAIFIATWCLSTLLVSLISTDFLKEAAGISLFPATTLAFGEAIMHLTLAGLKYKKILNEASRLLKEEEVDLIKQHGQLLAKR